MRYFISIQYLYNVFNSSYAISDHPKLNPLFDILSTTDLVYNHAAKDCGLFRGHTEAAYNLINSPHFKSSIVLDSILIQFTQDANKNKLLSKRITLEIKEHHLQLIRHYLLDELISKYRFSGFYICDIDSIIQIFY
ncbi:unnamed protein product [Rotaria sordida]|uniref:Glycogen debranching enzyme glucanotransferase domain-containing protein n=2 Tax=Rotaria sordida TaxID=392033 RepID=A0A813VN93_9BILA|nr:unnamed protein product [Rotaria sordida]CAF0844114.1 unnamed protein product [Rotaria sordida]CAF4077830.1 unnamed protein product [Rotaria sordida]